MKFSVQENLVPGETLVDKWRFAQKAGFHALELRGKGDLSFETRMPEFKEALKAGADLATVCPQMDHFLGDWDPDKRKDAIKNLKMMLNVIAELGGKGVMTPSAWGLHSERLTVYPPPPRTGEEDKKILIDGFHQLAEHAQRVGVWIALEPLNSYETHMVNTLAEALEICEAVGLPSMKVVGDTFHMAQTEEDSAKAIKACGPRLAHMQVMDTNRHELGKGQLDVDLYIKALTAIGYDGDLALECRLLQGPEIALPRFTDILRSSIERCVGRGPELSRDLDLSGNNSRVVSKWATSHIF